MEVVVGRTNPLVEAIEARLAPVVPEGGMLYVERFITGDDGPEVCFIEDTLDPGEYYACAIVQFPAPAFWVYAGMAIPAPAVRGEDCPELEGALAEVEAALRAYFDAGGEGAEVLEHRGYLPRHGVVRKKDVDAIMRELQVGIYHPSNLQA